MFSSQRQKANTCKLQQCTAVRFPNLKDPKSYKAIAYILSLDPGLLETRKNNKRITMERTSEIIQYSAHIKLTFTKLLDTLTEVVVFPSDISSPGHLLYAPMALYLRFLRLFFFFPRNLLCFENNTLREAKKAFVIPCFVSSLKIVLDDYVLEAPCSLLWIMSLLNFMRLHNLFPP